MPQTLAIQVTVSDETAEFLRQQLASGEYASESEVFAHSINVLREDAIWTQEMLCPDLSAEEQNAAEFASKESWLTGVAVPAYDRILAEPSLGISLEEVESDLASDLEALRTGR